MHDSEPNTDEKRDDANEQPDTEEKPLRPAPTTSGVFDVATWDHAFFD